MRTLVLVGAGSFGFYYRLAFTIRRRRVLC